MQKPFQLTASQGGWLRYTREVLRCLYFNSQPHKEADGMIIQNAFDIIVISTHSLTRRLTTRITAVKVDGTFQLTASQGGWRSRKLKNCILRDFNSQPHKEADEKRNICKGRSCYFNSQPHKEADCLPYTASNTLYISTHSLTRRLTFSTT